MSARMLSWMALLMGGAVVWSSFAITDPAQRTADATNALAFIVIVCAASIVRAIERGRSNS